MLYLTTLLPIASAGTASMHERKCNDKYYLAGGVVETSYSNNIDKMTAYLELYLDGKYLGSKIETNKPTSVDGLKSVAANITSCYHSDSGRYIMDWSTRIEYLRSNSDDTDAGRESYTKS
ncbi:hypothetical protein [Paenibacillus apiarius]|uniref:Uncharacterized protein n=1 Tax=Paenibacillus apiarius TaxID=46240 RepID=A0ABT4E0Y5_9BACL|nr:hypothetical protein [Paenibacillus apiarius]MCY9517030.1 hypothetical protein [Paenibacillus apiarius]MCY9523262.1 hypothetical protein [Paenibacillus apiarius]MCY9554240.1 hypothetical protein [Paenibacillus apiarius]MCY9560851.1 hypothetical protein [Paenibacillus apiarius]MCY9682772.1 hypothetical protein [Paenibacillus apiarius]